MKEKKSEKKEFADSNSPPFLPTFTRTRMYKQDINYLCTESIRRWEDIGTLMFCRTRDRLLKWRSKAWYWRRRNGCFGWGRLRFFA